MLIAHTCTHLMINFNEISKIEFIRDISFTVETEHGRYGMLTNTAGFRWLFTFNLKFN